MFDDLKYSIEKQKKAYNCRKALTTLKKNLIKTKKKVLSTNSPINRKREKETLIYTVDTMLKRTNLCLSILEEELDVSAALKKIRTIFSYVEQQYIELQKASEAFCREGEA